MICLKKFFCCTCRRNLKLEETIYDKIARQEYCAYCGWPIKEDHSPWVRTVWNKI